jgi:hypothetical protein
MVRIERRDGDKELWDGRKVAISSLAIWIVDADASRLMELSATEMDLGITGHSIGMKMRV